MIVLSILCQDGSTKVMKPSNEFRSKDDSWNHDKLTQLAKDIEGKNYKSCSISFGY